MFLSHTPQKPHPILFTLFSFLLFIKGNYPYKSNGYASEPDANYDSDYVLKYHSVDRKRTTSIGNQYEEKYVELTNDDEG